MSPRATEFMVVFGNVGSDAGYWVLTPHGVIHVPGWNPEARAAFDAFEKSYATLQAHAMQQIAGGQAQIVAAMGQAASQA